MSVVSTHRGRPVLTTLRVWALVLAAMIFGQFTSVSHAHDVHDEAPVACDVCLSSVSEDDEETMVLDDDPQPSDLSLDAIPSSLKLEEESSAPAFDDRRRTFFAPDDGRAQPRQTRAPPL